MSPKYWDYFRWHWNRRRLVDTTTACQLLAAVIGYRVGYCVLFPRNSSRFFGPRQAINHLVSIRLARVFGDSRQAGGWLA